MKRYFAFYLILLFLLASCSGEDSGGGNVAEVPSIAEIEQQAGSGPVESPINEGVTPIVYEGEDKVKADKAPEDMVFIKGGCFQMGNNNAQVDEKFEHEVCLDDFYLDRHEVTQARWEAVMGFNPSKFVGKDRPVEQVNYYDIQEFIEKSGGTCERLPTEAEWEYAAGGGLVDTRYYWGNLMDGEYAWFQDNSNETTHPVGKKKPNQYGLYDMKGNVWEWTDDWFANRYEKGKRVNPKGPAGGEYKVIRGGSMDTSSGALRITNRTWLHPKNRVYSKITTYGGIVNEIFNFVGFRCAQSVTTEESGASSDAAPKEEANPSSGSPASR